MGRGIAVQKDCRPLHYVAREMLSAEGTMRHVSFALKSYRELIDNRLEGSIMLAST